MKRWITSALSALILLLLSTAIPAPAQGTNPLRINCPPNLTNWVCSPASFDRVNYPTPTTTDNCTGTPTVVCTPPTGSTFILGSTVVTCRATNSCRETATCTFTVTVAHDTVPPVLQCPTNRTVVLCGTASTIPVTFPLPSATDNADTNVSVTCSPPSGSLFPIGTTPVVCTAADNCTNRTTCTFTVTVVRDTIPPTIRCPANTNLVVCSLAGGVVNFPAPAVSDNLDPAPTVTCVPASGSVFPPGTNTVTCTALDDCNNRSTCSFRVTVVADTTPPVIQCPSNIVLWTCSTNAVTHYGVTATDNLDLDVKVDCSPPPGTALPVGITTVNCTATDDCGNRSTCSFTVRVIRDTTPPAIQCPSNLVFNCLCPGQVFNLDFFQATATDDHDPSPIIVCNPPSLVSSPGVHLITCTATDNCGNSNRCQFTVTFNYDTTPPAITCPTNMIVWSCSNSARVNFSVNATDACDPAVTVICAPPSGSLFALGTTSVTCTAVDRCTNRSTCTFTVTVNRDTAPPVLVCPTNIVTSICSTCAVAQCVANPPTPIRPASVGNGLFYSSAASPDLTFNGYSETMFQRAEAGYHPIHVNAYQPVGEAGTAQVRFGAAWVRDDDSAFPYGYGAVTTVGQLHAEELAQASSRPISLSGYQIGPGQTRFAAAYLQDDGGYPWRLILDRDFDQYQAEIVALAAQGFRPISVSGYSFHGEAPRYSGIFVQDGLTGNDWITAHRIAEGDYQTWLDGWWNQGFRPISVSGYTIGNETYFTAVLVRLPGSGEYVARHGLTEAEFEAEDANWRDPASNNYHTTFRPVVVSAYRSHAQGGGKRFAAVWRSSSPRVFSITGTAPSALAAFDNAMRNHLQARDANAATLCISKNGGIVLHRGYTWAPLEFKQTQPCTRFRIASASKALTAIAIMKLLEGNTLVGMKGGGLQALTLDTPVFQMNGMPDLPAAYGPTARGITIRQLLQHRAGWGNGYEPLYADRSVAAALNESVPLSRQDRIDFMMTPDRWPTPGDPSSVGYSDLIPASRYSNFGFSLLAQLIEVVSNQSYETYVRNQVLLPVGATHTRLGRTARLAAWTSPDEVTYTSGVGTDPRYYVSDAAYNPLSILNPTGPSVVAGGEPGPGFPPSAYGRFNVNTIDAAGGWVATSDDLVRVLRSFDAYDPATPGPATPLLEWRSIWEMWSNPANLYAIHIGDKYTLGWQQTTLPTPAGNVIEHSHGGDIDGAHSSIVRRADGLCFAAMVSKDVAGTYTAISNALRTITNWPVCADGAVVHYPTPQVTDNVDANATVVCTPPSGSFFPLGSSVVTCTATDRCGNQRTCTFRVTVQADSQPPALQCPTNRVVWTCSSNGAIVNFPSPVASDDRDPNPTVVCVPASGSQLPVGRTVVTCTATDDCTNRTTCTFTVTVNRDTTPPRLECPTNRVVWTCAPGGVAVNFSAPEVFDNHDPNPSVVCVPASGAVFPPGNTTVDCTATDNCGNRATCTFQVTVRRDTNAPTLTCPDDRIVWSCNPNGVAVNFATPAAVDDWDASPTVNCVPSSGSVFPQGATVVTCTATDDCGNRRTCTFTVRVAPDTVPPTIECPPDRAILACSPTGRVVNFPTPGSDDNGDASPTVTCVPPSGSVFPLGTTTVTCTAIDACGNRTQCTFRIALSLDSQPPTITCPSNIVVQTCDSQGASVDWPTVQASDNAGTGLQVSCTPGYGMFPIGKTTVTCQATDPCGNRSTCSFTVTVIASVEVPGTDANGDGLSDIWQAHYNAYGLPPGEDTDGDGMTNADEKVAGTNPRQADDLGEFEIQLLMSSGVSQSSTGAIRWMAAPGKLYQPQFTAQLGEPWSNVGRPQRPAGGWFEVRFSRNDTNLPAGASAQGFFRLSVSDVDEDGDGITAWEESIIGTSDLTPNTHGNPGGDHQAALDWIAGHPAPARLREVAMTHVGGSPEGPTQTKLVTATGTGGWLKLSSWTLNPGTLDPVHLQDTQPIPGWNAKLHTLEPPLSPTLTLNPFVSGRLREDGNLWLTTRRVDAAGAHAELETIGYGANVSLQVYDYAIAHRAITAGIGDIVQQFILVTPIMARGTNGQKQLRLVTWSIHPLTGDINGIFDSGNLGHAHLPDDGGRLQIVPEAGARFVVSYINSKSELSSWFFDVENNGIVTPRSGGTSGFDIRGNEMSPIAAGDFSLGALNASGFVTLLAGTNCAAKLAVWEDRVRVAGDTSATGEPYYVTDNTLDLNPNGFGVAVVPPNLPDSWDDTVSAHDEFGRALAVGDFNGDGRADVAIGAPGQNVGKDGAPTANSAGTVNIMYGSSAGLTATHPDAMWSQDSDGVLGVADTGDAFGHALAVGDFNGDGFADLAIGAPFEDVDGVANAGAVNVLYGSASGLRANGNQVWFQGANGLAGAPGADEWFGYALATGDFNGDGRVDLAIGVPKETVNGLAEAGAVQILYGSAAGLSAAAGPGTQLLHQGSPAMLGALEAGDHFGVSLAAGDINHDGRDDLVVGIPNEGDNGAVNAGAVQIIYGSAGGLGAQNQLITQGQIAPALEAFPAAAEAGDSFGSSLAVADFNGDGFADVAIGAPYENIENGNLDDAGVVHVLRGSAGGVTAGGHQLLSQVIAEVGDNFGFSLAAGDFNGDGRADLAVGILNENVINNSVTDAGAVDVYHGAGPGLNYATTIYQGALGNTPYEETAEAFDRFSFALAAGDLNGDGRDDLVIGVPDEDLVRDDDNLVDAGVIHAVYGGAAGLSGDGDQVWAQGVPRRVRVLLTDADREAALGIGGGKVFEKMPAGERTNVHVASVTKTMTLLLAVELLNTPAANVHLDDPVPVSELAAGTGGSHVDLPYGEPLLEGDEMPLELLLYGMMLRSCNKSSVAIAEHLARKQYQMLHGSIPNNFDACGYFVTDMMQPKATALQMVNTIFGHPAGGTITPPQDLINLWRYAWQFSQFRRFSTDAEWIDAGEDALHQPKIWSLTKLSDEGGYPGLQGWKGGNGGLWKGTFPFGVPFCTSSVLGQATRLEHTLIFALEQTGNRWGSVRQLLDHGFRLLFTPDHRGAGGINTPSITDFALRKIHDSLTVSAVIYGADQLRLDAWQTVAGLGQATSLNASSVAVNNLPAGSHLVRTKILDVAKLPTVGAAEADYVTGRLEGGDLHLDVWRVAEEP